MLKNLLVTFVFFTSMTFFAGQGLVKAQEADYGKLTSYLESKPNDRASIVLIIDHLKKTGGTRPLDELVNWAQKGFPEFHDEHGSWHIDVLGFHSNFEQSLYYFIEECPAAEKGRRYLQLVEELRSYAHFTYPLTQSAYRFLTSEELEAEFYRLVKAKDPEERSRGFVLGYTLANKSSEIASVYLKAVKDEPAMDPRFSALGLIAMTRSKYPREITFAGLDRLLNDPETQIRDFGGVIVRQSADFFSIWTEKDIPLLLAEMMKSPDIQTRRTLAMTVAKLTTDDKNLYVQDEKWEDNPQERFLALVKTSGSSIEGGDLVNVWKEWWTPLIPKYMIKREGIACGYQ